MFPISKNKMSEGVFNFKVASNELELADMGKNINNELNISETENADFYTYINKNEICSSDTEHFYNYTCNEKKYTYSALDVLNKEEPTFSDTINVFICAFHINEKGKHPFLQFVMKKFDTHFFEDILTMPCFTYFGKGRVIDECVSKLDELFVYEKINKQEVNYKYEGYIVEEEELYIFFDVSKLNIETMELCRNDHLWFVLPDEIINYNYVCNFPIHKNVVEFFLKNPDFLILEDSSKNHLQSPIIAYRGVHENKLKFMGIFGASKSEVDAIAGPYYYFTTYEKAIEQGGWSSSRKDEFRHGMKLTETYNGKYDRGGIVRFAIFLGSLKVSLNYPEDNIDSSDFKYQKLEDNKDLLERHTIRLTDYDGKWTELYDSIYIGNLELDNGTKLMDAPYWVVKDYDQQLPLSFHRIDKTTLGDVWENRDDYYIK